MNIDSVIHNYLLSKESKEELAALELWKEESKNNLLALQQLEKNWELLDDMKDYQEFDSPKAWDKLDVQLTEEKEIITTEEKEIIVSEEKGTSVFPLWKMAMAASIALLAGFLIWNSTTETQIGDTEDNLGLLAASDQVISKNLEDGSAIWVNKASELDLGHFTKENRNINLNKGEAFFQVAPDQNHPFTVDVSDFEIRVVGTAFNVKKMGAEIEVYVQEGIVAVSNGKRTVQLSAGDMITGTVDNFMKFDKNNDNLVSWKTEKLVFNNTFLPEALQDLSRHYGKTIELSVDTKTENCFINTEFQLETLDEVIEELKVLFQIKVNNTQNKIVITEINC